MRIRLVAAKLSLTPAAVATEASLAVCRCADSAASACPTQLFSKTPAPPHIPLPSMATQPKYTLRTKAQGSNSTRVRQTAQRNILPHPTDQDPSDHSSHLAVPADSTCLVVAVRSIHKVVVGREDLAIDPVDLDSSLEVGYLVDHHDSHRSHHWVGNIAHRRCRPEAALGAEIVKVEGPKAACISERRS